MFGIGFSELAIIVLLIMIVIRPDDLPAFFRKLGHYYAQAKKVFKEITAVKDDFIKQMDIAASVLDSDDQKAEDKKTEANPQAPMTPKNPSKDVSTQEELEKPTEESQKE